MTWCRFFAAVEYVMLVAVAALDNEGNAGWRWRQAKAGFWFSQQQRGKSPKGIAHAVNMKLHCHTVSSKLS